MNSQYEGKDRYQNPKVAGDYDDIRFVSMQGKYTNKREIALVLKSLEIAGLQSGEILDLPCGTGRVTEALLDKGFRVTGGDISEEMMSHAKKKTVNYGDQVQFAKADIENLQFPDNSFDAVTTIRLLHHIPPSLHIQVLSELHRVSRQWVVITFSTKYALQNVRRNFKSVFTKFPRYSISPSLFKSEVDQVGFDIVSYIPMFPLISESNFVLLKKR